MDLVALKQQRKTIKASITRIYNYCQQDNITIEEVSARMDRANELFQQYNTLQDNIDELSSHAEDDYREQLEETFYSIKATYYRLKDVNKPTQGNSEMASAMQVLVEHQNSMVALIERFTNTIQPENASTPQRDTSQSQSELRLPQVQLPEFDGTLLEWVRFKDLFEAMVHNRVNLSKVEKLEYLHSKLKGDALLQIKHLKPTNQNYDIAWDLLKQKYDNIEMIKTSYLELIIDQPAMKSASLTEVKRVYNNANEGFNALKSLDEGLNQWSVVLLFNTEKKLDNVTAALWYREKSCHENITFQQFLKFLERRIVELENVQKNKSHGTVDKVHHQTQLRSHTTIVQTCPLCPEKHLLFQCNKFRALDVKERRLVVQKNNMCFNCLQPSHRAIDCKKSLCRQCGKKHNSLLHLQTSQVVQNSSDTLAEQPSCSSVNVSQQQITSSTIKNKHEINETSKHVTSNTVQSKNSSYVILPTAIVAINDINGSKQHVRALLDSGSQGTLITEACVQRLGIKRQYDKTVIFGLGNNEGNRTKGKVSLKISSIDGNELITAAALCLKNLTQILPSQTIEREKFEYFKNLKLADPYLHKPAKIDLILGADVFMECCLSQKQVHPTGSPIALETIFGWVLMGHVDACTNYIYSNHVSLELDQQLQRFWEVEDIPTHIHQLPPEDEEAENYFVKTTERNKSGRYIVRLPFKNNEINIGQSKNNALNRLHNMERKFKHDAEIEANYKEFMHEYMTLNHMNIIDETKVNQQICFLPHHAVIKPSSTTSKLRVVFDASNKTSNGRSLNDNLLVGPKIQKNLFDIILNFRVNAVAITADIEKMYRQILIHNDDRFMQCILWRKTENEEVKAYCLNTVTYGTASAPFLAIRTLHQIANDKESLYPKVSHVIKNNFYVDDFMYSAENPDEAINIKDDLTTVLSQAGFRIRKWSTNSPMVLNTVPLSDRAQSVNAEIQNNSTVFTLGLMWDTKGDYFKYSVSLSSTSQSTTKRAILSDIAKLFDPMGWIAPVVIHMKIFIQKLWLRGMSWDEQLPTDLLKEWFEFRNNLTAITQIKINRWFQVSKLTTTELHGFSDASERAYAAAIYIKVVQNNEIFTHLVASKTRVAPVKQISLPRLELCGAHLLTKLIKKICSCLEKPDIPIYGWTDSMVVLAWISDHPCRWKSFIANRTTDIINVIPARNWCHIKSQQNPADMATRGINATKLIDNKLWWHGPDELRMNKLPTHNHINVRSGQKTVDLEERKKCVINSAITKEPGICDLYSSFTKLIRITALIKRFINNCKNKTIKIFGFIKVSELREAHTTLIKISQRESFSKEISIIKSERELSVQHKLSSLAPFIDSTGILRVGGRIIDATVSYDQKHPIILHNKHSLTKLIIRHYHLQYCHAGMRLLHNVIHLKYWIPSAVVALKECIYKCIICLRQRAKPFKQQMGNLPDYRLVPAPVFLNVGIDYAGPVQVRPWKGRGTKIYKCWIAIFICLVTKAMHIELVTELSTDAFIAAFRRFVSRRGRPLNVYSDNGTNFVGANNQLKDLYNFLRNNTNQEYINTNMTNQEIQWHFNPPAAPHFGGIWEAAVKSVKYHMKRVLKDAHPTYEEMQTVLYQIEACLNSRPLCNKFAGDMDPLTPAHFILLRSMTALPQENLYNMNKNHLTRWQYVQRLVQQFWKKWSMEYLHQLQQRPKWKQKLKNLNINDIVVIKEENTAPSQWLLGKIIELHCGKDGLARVASVKTQNGVIKRPIVKLCPLVHDS